MAFDPKKVGFAVITSYPKWYSGKIRSIKHTDKVRGDLAIEFAQKATDAGYPIVLSDGKSAKTFVRMLQSLPGLIVTKRKSVMSGQGKRLALEMVSKIPGVEVIVLCEPEKVSFLTHCVERSVMPILEGKADIVVPKREDKLFKSTYPDYMYLSEKEANSIYNEAIVANNLLPKEMYEMDSFFGPRVFRNTKEFVS
ncbi:MAG TPA: hypothetical protein VLF20_03280, partial [Patescibacteria group bacterium]|nr:hypothetical protein [Patescibacteria group bacterium]